MGAGKGKQRRVNAIVSGNRFTSAQTRAVRMLAASYSDTGSSMPTNDYADELFDEGLLGLDASKVPGDGETVFTPEGKKFLETVLKDVKPAEHISPSSLLVALGVLQLDENLVSDDEYEQLFSQGVFVEKEGGIELSLSSWELVQRITAGDEIGDIFPVPAVDVERVNF